MSPARTNSLRSQSHSLERRKGPPPQAGPCGKVWPKAEVTGCRKSKPVLTVQLLQPTSRSIRSAASRAPPNWRMDSATRRADLR